MPHMATLYDLQTVLALAKAPQMCSAHVQPSGQLPEEGVNLAALANAHPTCRVPHYQAIARSAPTQAHKESK